jgi:hypothetical protein
MRIEMCLSPNCSEAVFRFYTEDPQIARRILQAFANEVAHANHEIPEEVLALVSIKDVESIRLSACAGLGDPLTECHYESEKKAFVLCIGNNDISADGEGCHTVKKLGVKVEEAETSPSLAKRWARDCTCGIVYFDDYSGRIVEKPKSTNPVS